MKELTNKKGFTLIELLITIAITAVLMGLAVPSFKESIKNNRLATTINDYMTTLNFARSEALKRGLSITVRKVDDDSFTKRSSTANWEDGWDVFTDNNGNGIFDTSVPGTPDDVLIRTTQVLKSNFTID